MKKFLMLALPIMLISACAHKVEVEDYAKYKCGDEVVSIDFLEDDTAVLKINGDNYVLDRMVAASGAKYVGRDITFWNKGDNATLIFMGRTYPKCIQIGG